jgi:cell division protein FtsL
LLAARKAIHAEYQSEVVQQPPVTKSNKAPRLKKNPWSRYFLMVVITVAIALTITGRYAAVARAGYEIAKLKYTVATLEKENDVLQLAVANFKAPGRVQEIATSRLGMQLPDKVFYASGILNTSVQSDAINMKHTAIAPWGITKAEARNNR